MKMEREDINIDNFIREKINGFRPQGFAIEPTPDFAKRTMGKIRYLESRRCFLTLYGGAILWALGPLALRQLWLLIRNDYFAAAYLPFSSVIILVYRFFLSWGGTFLLLAMGIFASLFFVLKLRRGYNSFVKTA